MNTSHSLSRRQVLALLAGGVSATAFASQTQTLMSAAKGAFVSDEQRLCIGYVCDIVIPNSDTQGALGAGVPTFLLLAFEYGLFGGNKQSISLLCQLLNNKAKPSDFIGLSKEERECLVQQLDQDAFKNRLSIENTRLWKTFKEAVIVGYYTSEIGASKELTYLPIAGMNYDSDVAIEDSPHISNLWMENAF